MKKLLRGAAALVLAAGMLMSSALAATTSFSDVSATNSTYSWAYTYIYRAAQNGLVSGYNDGTYKPGNTVALSDFGTMVCSLIYPGGSSSYAGLSSYWWYQYIETIYQKGILTGTTAGNKRAADGRWTATDVEKTPLSRYDMAQIIYNVANKQSWSKPSDNELLYAYYGLSDIFSAPANYQQAAAYCYAKGFIAGMGDGTFSGSKSMNRAQAAVVLCAMFDAKNKVDSPTYTNKSRLVNGSDPTEENVNKALLALKSDYPTYSDWNLERAYTSAKLGTGTGAQAFAYMLSDKVFGAMNATQQKDPDLVKAGDLIYLRSSGRYGVVYSVDRDEIDYVYCDSLGLISWNGNMDVDDLTSKDTIYTRYEGAKGKTTLANGDKATVKNVTNALDTLLGKKAYREGTEWDEASTKYTSDALGTGRHAAAFAYYISDQIFDDLPVSDELDDADDMRVGDVLERDWDGSASASHSEAEIMVITNISKDRYDYVYLDDNDEICYDHDSLTDLNKNWDFTIYTRYPDETGNDNDDDTLSNGKTATEKNVLALLDDVRDDYDDGSSIKKGYSYKSSVLGRGGDENESFAYYVSDEIFGGLSSTKLTGSKVSKMKVGDVVYRYDEEDYVVVTSVNTSKDTYEYVYVNTSGKIRWDRSADMNKDDTVYTRYPDGSKSSGDDTLSNGKTATAKNVRALLSDVRDDYDDDFRIEKGYTYKSSVLGRASNENKAFAYYVSDEIFGDLSSTELTGNKVYNMQVGDVVYRYDEEDYVVVTSVDTDKSKYEYVFVDENRYVSWDNSAKMDKDDTVYTRYP